MIGILSASVSERHLSQPVLDELNKLGLDAEIIHIPAQNIIESYDIVNRRINDFTGHPKLKFILAVADRPEQMGGVLAAFQNRAPIGHLYAGDHNTIATFDDIHRHAITLYSQIQFCSNEESAANVRILMRNAGLESNAHTVGATHFNGIDMNKILSQYHDWRFNFPNEMGSFVLVSINSETMGDDEKLKDEILEKLDNYRDCPVVQVRGNEDCRHIDNTIFVRAKSEHVDVFYLDRMQHDMYIYLMMMCRAFITNSSAAIYEAPHLLADDQIVMVGQRNKGRTKVPGEAHDGKASKRVAELIKGYLEL